MNANFLPEEQLFKLQDQISSTHARVESEHAIRNPQAWWPV